jgi:hypothetical protein
LLLLHASKKMTTMGSIYACHSYFKVATIDACPPHEDNHKEVGSATHKGPLAQLLAIFIIDNTFTFLLFYWRSWFIMWGV